jgi:hypothetical protein
VLRIEMLPAAHGDALLVEWGTKRSPHRMLVDAGPLGTYAAIHDRIDALGRMPALDLLVVTHIDGDHIEGVVRLLQDRRRLRLQIGDVWFNGWPQLSASDTQGADYGEMVGALLQRDPDLKGKWNAAFQHHAAAVPKTGTLKTYTVDGARLTVLGPGPTELRKLQTQWTKVLADVDVVPGDADGALERLSRRTNLAGIEGGDVQGGVKTKLDNSVANGSSISVLFEYDEHALLLTGDSHSPPLVDGIRRLLAERGQDRLAVDAFKLPHHCSKANVTEDLLALVDTPRYLVSTNGARYRHPDKEAVLRVIDRPERRDDLEVVFNYVSPTTRRWTESAAAKRYHYTPVFPDGANPGITLEV